MGLAGIGEAAAFSGQGGYKALVCVFLYGGNDHANTLIPFDQDNHSKYARIRSDIAISRASLANTVLRQPENQPLTDGIQFALAPTMPRLKERFDQGKLAALLNVGPLIAPLTKAQFESSNTTAFPRPDKLFSHNDQQSTWQASQPEGASSGWGGRMGDLAQSANQNAMFTAINTTGNAVFMSGARVSPYKINREGATLINTLRSSRVYGSTVARSSLEALLRSHHQHVFEQDYVNIVGRSIEFGGFVNDALQSASLTTNFPASNSLAEQLNLVARMIASRNNLGVTRQVFLVSLGGFDHHSKLLGSHPALLGQVDEALDSFYRATLELGVSDQVTTFTASDFGRTLTSNGDGTDHGWGSHHFILGGAVNGGRFFGKAPHISTTSNDQVGRGRLLPTTSVDEYSTTLALWLGVAPSELPSIAPNIGRFARPDLGFLR
jgi:uncharacterized protein (DUF1501 family)